MARLVALLAVIAAAAFVLWPDGAEDQRPPDRPAAAGTPVPTGPLARGVERSRAVITVRRGDREYELRGALDLSEGYRFRGRITKSSDEYREDGTPIWLAGGRGTVWGGGGTEPCETLTKPPFPGERPTWLDDHPPTLPLTRDPFDGEGAEVYAHLSLLALKHGVHGRRYDFADRPPGYTDLRKAALAAGNTELDVTTGGAGQVERLRLELAPATVDVRLFASNRPVPALRLRRFAME